MNQQTRIRLTIAAVLCLIVLVVVGFVWRMSQPVIMNSQELRANGAVQLNNPRIFSDFELIDHNGDAFTLENLKGDVEYYLLWFHQLP